MSTLGGHFPFLRPLTRLAMAGDAVLLLGPQRGKGHGKRKALSEGMDDEEEEGWRQEGRKKVGSRQEEEDEDHFMNNHFMGLILWAGLSAVRRGKGWLIIIIGKKVLPRFLNFHTRPPLSSLG